jgi:hypothetical protein
MKLPLTLVMTALALAALTGCYAEAGPPYAETTITAAPVDIDTYPSVVYEGRPVYFYGDRWWYRDGGRWTYYHREPTELHRQREHVRRDRREDRR